MTREDRLARIVAADRARRAAEEAARHVSRRDESHPLRKAHRKAILAFADELVKGMREAERTRYAGGVSLRLAAEHLDTSPQMLSQRIEAAERLRRGERPWPPKRRKKEAAA